MDFGKLFKRQKSVKDKRKPTGSSQPQSYSSSPETGASNSKHSNQVKARAKRRGTKDAVAVNSTNRWSFSSEGPADNFQFKLTKQLERRRSEQLLTGQHVKRKPLTSSFLDRSLQNVRDDSRNCQNGHSTKSILNEVADTHIRKMSHDDQHDLRAVALDVSQNLKPPPYQDIHQSSAFDYPTNSESVEEAGSRNMVKQSNDNVEGSWGSDEFDNSSSDDCPSVSNNGREAGAHVETFSVEKNKNHDDIVDGLRKLKLRPKRSHKDEKPEPEHDEIVFVELPPNECSPGPRLKEPPPNLQNHQIQRRRIIGTILSSECSYIESLERLEIQYRKPLLDMRNLISPDAVEKIFYKIEEILECHRLFQIALAAAIDDWDKHEKIGDTFVACFSKSMVLECYSKYINNFTTAMELVSKNCKQKIQFYDFLQKKQRESKDRLSLFGLMLKPVQRFPQFIMLVQDLLKNTPSNHEDSLPLQLALTALETLAENLDRCRAESEERSDMVELLNSSNIKLTSPFTKGGHARRLIKKGFLRELAFDEGGAIEKDKESFFVLTNDMMMSCSCSNRKPMKSGLSTFRDMYKLRWCTSLDDLQIQYHEDSSSAEEITKINNDIAALKSIGELVKKLNFPCPGLSSDLITSSINALGLKADNCGRTALLSSATSLTICFPQKDDQFKRTLMMPNVHTRNEWRESITNTKLAIDSHNVSSWFTSSNLESYNLWKPPLFLQSVNCEEQNESLQVQCAHVFVTGNHTTSVWLAFNASTIAATVNIYDMQDQKLKKTRSMQVGSSVQCMECWNPFSNSLSVWLGMESGSLCEYGTEFPHPRICEVTMPTMSSVMLVKAIENRLYIGLLDGSLEVYRRPAGSKGLERVQAISVGDGPLACLSLFGDRLWTASGNDIITINPKNFEICSARKIQSDKQHTVSQVVLVGSGFWVSFCGESSLHLYHRDSMKLLQELNLSTPIRDFLRDYGWHTSMKAPCHVTALWSAYHHLMAGTGNGLVLVMPLPKLPGSVPKTTGPCRICHHMLTSPVCFIRTSYIEPPTPVANRSNKNSHGKSEETSEKLALPTPLSMQQDTMFTERPNEVNAIPPRRVSEVSDLHPPIPERSPRLSSAYGSGVHMRRDSAKDDFVNEHLAFKKSVVSRKSSSRSQSIRDTGNNFPVMIACGDGYRYVSPQNPTDSSSASQSTAILLWKMVL